MRRLLGRPHTVVAARPDLPSTVDDGVSALVVGGGVAGISAAVVLAERGVRVTLLEAQPHLGGRLGAWHRRLPDGTDTVVEHGFHAFFRQYYTLRSILRRVDPELSFLRPLDYPVLSRSWPAEDFASLPTQPPLNLLALLARSPSLRLADLRRMDPAGVVPLLGYDRARIFAQFDGTTAADFLDGLGLPDRARAMLFEVFAHSFFNHERDFSAAELLMMFHYYFLGNPEGLGIDAPREDYLTCLWKPLAAHLAARRAEVRTGVSVQRVEPTAEHGWRVQVEGAAPVPTRHLVLAVDPGALRRILGASPELATTAPRLARQVAAIRVGPPYAVARLWTEGDVARQRPVFSGVSREATLDSVTLYHRLEQGSAQWAEHTGGAVVELHAYACDEGVPAPELTARMREELAGLWPESAGLRVLDVEEHVRADAPAFHPGSDTERPGVTGDARGLRLAGDHVRLPFPSALLERAAASGVLAANDVLREEGAGPEPVLCIPPRGLLARIGNPFTV